MMYGWSRQVPVDWNRLVGGPSLLASNKPCELPTIRYGRSLSCRTPFDCTLVLILNKYILYVMHIHTTAIDWGPLRVTLTAHS